MVVCRFSGLVDTAEIQANSLHVRGGRMYIDEESAPAAVHRERHWEFAGHHFVRFEVDGPLSVTLLPAAETEIRRFSEPRIWFADGVLHSPTGHIVCLDEASDTWLDVPSCTRYSEMIVETWTPERQPFRGLGV